MITASAPRVVFLADGRADANRDAYDPRDIPFVRPFMSLPNAFPGEQMARHYFAGFVKAGLILDQGSEGASLPFAVATMANYAYWFRQGGSKVERVSVRMLRQFQEIYGQAATGSELEGSCRDILRGWMAHGLCSERLWPFTAGSAAGFVLPSPEFRRDARQRQLSGYFRVDHKNTTDVQAALATFGSLVAVLRIHEGWSLDTRSGAPSTARMPVIDGDRAAVPVGLHATAILGYDQLGFIVQNSWGPGWGASGFAILSYADWLASACDAWVCSLSVPVAPMPYRGARAHARTAFVSSDGQSAMSRRAQLASRRTISDLGSANSLSLEETHHRSLIINHRDQLVRRLVCCRSADHEIDRIGRESPSNWIAANRRRLARSADLLVILLSGNYGTDDQAIHRHCGRLGHFFQANAIYPLFVRWETGLGPELHAVMERMRTLPGMADADRITEIDTPRWNLAVEAAVRRSNLPVIWRWSGHAGQRLFQPQQPMAQLLNALGDLSASCKPAPRIHLLAHSVGAQLALAFLESAPFKISTCTLLAPACTISAAEPILQRAAGLGRLRRPDLYVHVLSREREWSDVTMRYRGSLLSLISRAMEPAMEEPLLGLETSFNPRYFTADDRRRRAVDSWSRYWGSGGPDKSLVVHTDRMVPTSHAGGTWIHAGHAGFIADRTVMEAIVRRVTGQAHPHITDLNEGTDSSDTKLFAAES